MNASDAGRKAASPVAVVTGAASGIGLEIAIDLAARGYRIAACDIAWPDEAIERIHAAYGEALCIRADVADQAAVDAAVQESLNRFGRIDVLVNNAGLFTTLTRGAADAIDPQEWRRVVDVNVTGTWLFSRAVLAPMRAQRRGRIINITSATAFSTPPSMLHYVTSKGAVTAMTSALAREVGADGITVNAVAPGFTLSSGVRLHRAEGLEAQSARARSARAIPRDQEPVDLLGAVAFFAGDESGFVTGQTLVVDGGGVMR